MRVKVFFIQIQIRKSTKVVGRTTSIMDLVGIICVARNGTKAIGKMACETARAFPIQPQEKKSTMDFGKTIHV